MTSHRSGSCCFKPGHKYPSYPQIWWLHRHSGSITTTLPTLVCHDPACQQLLPPFFQISAQVHLIGKTKLACMSLRHVVLFFNWSIADIQCFVSFWCTVKWFSYIYIIYIKYICTYTHIVFHILFLYGLSQDIEYCSLCYTVGLCCPSILYIIVCIF